MYRLLTFYPRLWELIPKSNPKFSSEGQLRAWIAETLLTTDPDDPIYCEAEALLNTLDKK